MIFLDFIWTPNILAEDRVDGIANTDAGVLQYSYFVMPLRFCIDATDLFDLPSSLTSGPPELRTNASSKTAGPWFDLPLLDVCTVGTNAVLRAERETTTRYMIPGSSYLEFMREDSEVIVTSGINGRSVRTSYEALQSAFSCLASRTKLFCLYEVPELVIHPTWSKWLKDKGSPQRD